MGKPFVIFILIFIYAFVGAAYAQDSSDPEIISAADEQLIAVLDILELMEIVDDMALFQDMEFLMEGDTHESQD